MYTKLWVEVFIKPVLLIMKYIRSTHESDYALTIQTAECMLPYFFAACHHNYSRYTLFFVRPMAWLPVKVLDAFMKGEGSMHHIDGMWNGVPTDQSLESTLIRKGKGPSGVIGNTQNPQVMSTWVYSLGACVALTSSLQNMGAKEEAVQMYLKEESKGRIKEDAADRESLRKTMQKCIDPMDPASHPNGGLYNIQNGQLAHPEVNADRGFFSWTNTNGNV